MGLKKLNVGCGNDIREGWVNLDRADLPGVDIVHDIEKIPLPFRDEEFEEILCQDVLEHIEYLPVLRELHRILKTGGTLKIRVPHFTSRDNFSDPTHRNFFSICTFEFFVQNARFGRSYYFDYGFERIYFIKIAFRKGVLFYNYVVEPIVNLCPKMMGLYEATGLSRIFPAENLIVELRK